MCTCLKTLAVAISCPICICPYTNSANKVGIGTILIVLLYHYTILSVISMVRVAWFCYLLYRKKN